MRNTTIEIQNEEEHEKALKRILEIFGVEPLSKEEEELEILCEAVEKYEKIHYPI